MILHRFIFLSLRLTWAAVGPRVITISGHPFIDCVTSVPLRVAMLPSILLPLKLVNAPIRFCKLHFLANADLCLATMNPLAIIATGRMDRS